MTHPLPPDTLHLWQWTLNSAYADGLVLSDDEHQRASQLKFAVARERFIAGRSTLRHVLAQYTGERAQSLTISYNSHGKPLLKDHPSLHFNLSHTGSLALLAVSRDSPVGVDVEQVRLLPAMAEMLDMVLTEGEKSALLSLPVNEQERAFLGMWTRKEACMKAVGHGYKIAKRFALSAHPPYIVDVQDPSLTSLFEHLRLYKAENVGQTYVAFVAGFRQNQRLVNYNVPLRFPDVKN